VTRFVRVQSVATLRDLLDEHEPRTWTVPSDNEPGGYWRQRYVLQGVLLDAAQTVLEWRQDDDSPDSVANFARQVASCLEGPNYSLTGSGCTFVLSVEPAP
jgi:hypothetical protein